MHSMLVLGDLGSFFNGLANGIISWQFLQFVVAFLSFFGFVLTSATILVLAERKVIAWMQDRIGPYHTGPGGSLQSVADVVKLLLKEDIHAGNTDKGLFLFAPAVFLAPVIAAFVVLPFSPYIGLPGSALATGIVYLVAMSSLDVVGVVMAGWASNNKYSLIGGLRSAGQMISYELPLVLALIGVIMLTSILDPHGSGVGTISVKGVMGFQMSTLYPGKGIPFWDFIFEGFTPWSWFFLVQPLMLIIYYTCGQRLDQEEPGPGREALKNEIPERNALARIESRHLETHDALHRDRADAGAMRVENTGQHNHADQGQHKGQLTQNQLGSATQTADH